MERKPPTLMASGSDSIPGHFGQRSLFDIRHPHKELSTPGTKPLDASMALLSGGSLQRKASSTVVCTYMDLSGVIKFARYLCQTPETIRV